MTKTRQWSVFTAIAVLAVLAVGWFLLVKPQNSKVTSLKSQAASQQASNQLLVSQIATLQSEEKQLPQQQQALQKFATQVPTDASEPMIIRQLSAAAAGSGVDLVSITPGAPTAVAATATAVGGSALTPAASTGSTLVQLPISLGITGTFPNVESFFQSLEKLPRALLVTGWSLCPDPDTSAGSGGSVSCALPATPTGDTLPTNALGGVLTAYVFYAPPASATTTVAPGVTGTTPTPAGTPTTAGTPTPGTSTAATPSTDGASSAPAS